MNCLYNYFTGGEKEVERVLSVFTGRERQDEGVLSFFT